MLQWFDNFNSYGADKSFMLNGLYAEAGFVSLEDDPDTNAVGKVMRIFGGPSGSTQLRRVLTAAQETVGVALRLWLPSLPTEANISAPAIVFTDVANNILVGLYISTTGAVSAILNNVAPAFGSVIVSSAGPVLTANAWHHIEMKVKFHASAGTVEIRVNGVEVAEISGEDTIGTASGTCAQVAQSRQVSAGGNSIPYYIKDYVIWDVTGTHNTDFLGTVSVYRLVPNSDVTLGGWTTSSGATGYNLIDESPPVDAGYVQAGDPPPAACEFGLTNLPADVTSVRGVMSLVRTRKTDGGDGQLQVSVGSDGDYANGADRPVTTAFTYYSDIQEEDPATTAPWLPSAVDAATLVLNRTV